MFILRTISEKGLETNVSLSDSYSYVNRETQYDEFCRCYKAVFGINHVADLDEMSDNFSKNCYGIISYKEGSSLIPLYKGDANYIMSESGKTFANVTFR